jgi:outer membrane protein TolC
MRSLPISIAVVVAAQALAQTAAAQPAPQKEQPPRPQMSETEAANVADMTAAVPGGITSEQVGTRAAQTSYSAKAATQTLESASERVDQANVAWFPRFGLKASYTRLSDFTPPAFGGGGQIVATQAPPNTINPTPTIAASLGSFPIIVDNYVTQATISVPISDYFLRVNQSITAATHSEDAARFDVTTARAKSYADGKVAYYTWLRARGSLTVALQAAAVARLHLKDAQNQFTVGTASKADVLRQETQLAAAELAVEQNKAAVAVTERQVRVAMHAGEDEKLEPGDALDAALPPQPENLKTLVAEGQAHRPEVKSIDKNAESARKSADVQRAGKWPVVSGFGDVTYANPNPRRFPASQDWFPTWSVGAQVTWSPNDFLTAGPGAADFEARANALEAQKGTVRDGVELEVTQAYHDVISADAALTTTQRQLASAVEGERVARELFVAGRGTATTLIDAERDLTQARFSHLDARVNVRIARIRLDHALGRDTRAGAP